MCPIKRELVLNEGEAHEIWHTLPENDLVAPIMVCLRRKYESDYPEYFSNDCVEENSWGARIDTVNPRLRIKEFKIFIDEDFNDPRLTKIHITVDHNTHVEHFPEYLNAIRRTLANI